MATTADVTLTVINMVPGTESADLVAGGTAVNATQTFRVKVADVGGMPPGRGAETRILLVIEELGGGAATIVMEAGEYPPSLNMAKGTETLSLATSDLKIAILEAGRHLKADGYIKGLVNAQNCRVAAYRLPAGY